jgi:hypothetical protein
MRRWAILLLLPGFSCPAIASKSLPIEEFEQLLAKLQNKPDARVAQELADVELTERVTLARLTKWEKEFPEPKSREALLRLADSAAFLKTPAMDLLRIAPPDNDTQERMLTIASGYVKTTMTHLPDLSATRQTTHFDDVAAAGAPAEWHIGPVGIPAGKNDSRPLHSTGASTSTVTYREGKVTPTSAEGTNGPGSQPQAGMTTSGEFGPLLAIVVGDALQNHVAWSHWEQSFDEPMAILSYSVPEDHSNFPVHIPAGSKTQDLYPAYHGEIAIDPATGSVLRFTVVADMTGTYQSVLAAIAIEYAQVAIGDQTCLCPVHGVALSRIPAPGAAPDEHNGTTSLQTQLNDVEFTGYRPLGSEAPAAAQQPR